MKGPRMVPTVVDGMDGAASQTLEGESEARAAILTWAELVQEEEEIQGSCQSHWCPRGLQGLSGHHVTLRTALTSETSTMIAQLARVATVRLGHALEDAENWKMRDWKIREQKTYGTLRVA